MAPADEAVFRFECNCNVSGVVGSCCIKLPADYELMTKTELIVHLKEAFMKLGVVQAHVDFAIAQDRIKQDFANLVKSTAHLNAAVEDDLHNRITELKEQLTQAQAQAQAHPKAQSSPDLFSESLMGLGRKDNTDILHEKIYKLQDEVSDLYAKLRETRHLLDHQIKNGRALAHDDLDKLVTRLQGQRKIDEKELLQLRNRSDEVLTLYKEMEPKVAADSRDDARAFLSEIDGLKAEIERLKIDSTNSTKQFEETNGKLREKIGKSQEELNSWLVSYVEATKHGKVLQQDVDTLRSQNAQLDQKAVNFQDQVRSLQDQLRNAQDQARNLHGQARILQGQAQAIRNQANEACTKARQARDKAMQDLASEKNRSNKLDIDKQHLIQENQRLVQENQRLVQEKQLLLEQIQRRIHELGQAQQQGEALLAGGPQEPQSATVARCNSPHCPTHIEGCLSPEKINELKRQRPQLTLDFKIKEFCCEQAEMLAVKRMIEDADMAKQQGRVSKLEIAIVEEVKASNLKGQRSVLQIVVDKYPSSTSATNPTPGSARSRTIAVQQFQSPPIAHPSHTTPHISYGQASRSQNGIIQQPMRQKAQASPSITFMPPGIARPNSHENWGSPPPVSLAAHVPSNFQQQTTRVNETVQNKGDSNGLRPANDGAGTHLATQGFFPGGPMSNSFNGPIGSTSSNPIFTSMASPPTASRQRLQMLQNPMTPAVAWPHPGAHYQVSAGQDLSMGQQMQDHINFSNPSVPTSNGSYARATEASVDRQASKPSPRKRPAPSTAEEPVSAKRRQK